MSLYVNEDDAVVTRNVSHDDSSLYKALTWLALVISAIALIVGWMAYNRTGEDLEERIQRGVEQSLRATGEAANNAADATGDALNEAGDAIDAGPDGVDEDDTDVQPAS